MKQVTELAGAAAHSVARSKPQREVAGAGHRSSGPGQGPAEPGEAEGGLWQPVAGDRPCGGTGEALLAGDRRWCEALHGRSVRTDGPRRPAPDSRQMVPRVRQVMRQTKARIFHGDTRSEGKIVSVFEPSTEVIRKGKTVQAHRVRQAGQAAGGGESDHRRLRSVCPAAAVTRSC